MGRFDSVGISDGLCLDLGQRLPAEYADQIVLECEKIIEGIARRFAPPGNPDFEDLCQIGRIAAVKCARTFSPQKGPWFAYARKVITNAIYAECRSMARRARHERFIGRDENLDFLLGNVESGSKAGGAEREDLLAAARNHIGYWLDSLSQRDRSIVKAVYYDGVSQAEAARRVGLTRARVGQIVSEALASGRRRLSRICELN